MISIFVEDNTTLSISNKSREVVSRMKDHKILTLERTEEGAHTNDIYMLAVALGLDSPGESVKKDGDSYTRTYNFKEMDRSLLIAALFDSMEDSNLDNDYYFDIKNAFALSKKYTDAGFEKLDEIISEAMYDPELTVRKLLEYVNTLYDDVVDA